LLLIVSRPLVGAGTQDYWRLPVPAQGPADTSAISVIARLEPTACSVCHPHQYQQWQESLHAHAVGPGLLGQLPLLDDATRRACLNCHAPRTEQQAGPTPGTNAANGVDCAGCHVRTHARFGPHEVLLTPHGVVQAEPLFKDAAFCAPCHQFGDDGIRIAGTPLENTVAEWRASDYPAQGKTCQACHMRDGSHHFSGIHDPATVRNALQVNARRTGDGVRIELRNRGALHRPSLRQPQPAGRALLAAV